MNIIDDETFRAWESAAPAGVRADPIWRFHAYRVALFVLDRAKDDARLLRAKRADREQITQLVRAVASIGANLAEGLGRATPADRGRFVGVALGSLREATVWYHSLGEYLPPEMRDRRIDELTNLRRLLIGSQRWLATRPERRSLI